MWIRNGDEHMEKQLETLINDVQQVVGVKATFLLNNRGEIVYPENMPASIAALLTQPRVDLVQALGIFDLTGNPVKEVRLEYAEGAILVYDNIGAQVKTRFGWEEAFLVIVCDKNANLPHLRLVVNVAITSLQNGNKGPKARTIVPIDKRQSLDKMRLDPALSKLLETVQGKQPGVMPARAARVDRIDLKVR
jgi:hypothetical protein